MKNSMFFSVRAERSILFMDLIRALNSRNKSRGRHGKYF
jgi:hypothetical protein